MERADLIEHLLEHYVSRDLFRYHASNKLIARGLPYSTSFLAYENSGTPIVSDLAIGRNRKALTNSSNDTLDHIHELLHKDFTLDEHVHSDGDLFTYVIEEDPLHVI